MKQEEIIVVRLSGGLTVGRYAAPTGGTKVLEQRARVLFGRNREARVTPDRVVLSTGVVAASEEAVREFRSRSEELASEVDLTEVWEVVRDEKGPVSLSELAELFWGSSPGPGQLVALLLHLESSTLYFAAEATGYAPRSAAAVNEILARRRRKEVRAREAESLVAYLSRGELPPELTPHQSSLMDHLRGYAVHGDNYTKREVARSILEQVVSGHGDLDRRSFDLLVRVGVLAPDEPLELERAAIREAFSDAALEEASALDSSQALGEPGRRDLTSVSVITIDDVGTQDRDDAISVEVEGPGGPYRVGAHIADAGALIPQGGDLDREAGHRMATLYLPERKVTMLPPRLCDDIGSLTPGQDRAALSVSARITEHGEVLDWDVFPSVVRSRAALSYEDADDAMEDVGHPWHQALTTLDRVARARRLVREKAGAVVLERPEMIASVAATGEVIVRVVPRSTPARGMVTEFMILCNSLLAEFCRSNEIPAAYRSQKAVDLSDVMAEVPEGPLRWHLAMRRLAPADLDTVATAHGGLGVSAYIQATSPLRRYPDMVIQRQISRFLSTGEPLYTSEAIASMAQRADVQMRELRGLEEERQRYWFLKYLADALSTAGEDASAGLLEAVVLENPPRRSALMELAEYPFRVRADLPASCGPGDTVTLRLHGVDLWRRTAQVVHQDAE